MRVCSSTALASYTSFGFGCLLFGAMLPLLTLCCRFSLDLFAKRACRRNCFLQHAHDGAQLWTRSKSFFHRWKTGKSVWRCTLFRRKSGGHRFTKCLARIAGPKGVLCNAVAPGIVKTEILSPEHEAQSQANIPLGRTGRAEEIAAVILFLCAPMSSYITGMVVDVNGGSYM